MIRMLLRLFPRAWRDRYGAEYVALLEDTGLGPATLANVLVHAGSVRVRQHRSVVTRAAGLITFALAEVLALTAGYTVNIFWLPRSPASLLLLVTAVVALCVTLAPVAALVGKVALRVVRR